MESTWSSGYRGADGCDGRDVTTITTMTMLNELDVDADESLLGAEELMWL